jgi:hypothetical protein
VVDDGPGGTVGDLTVHPDEEPTSSP